MACDFMSHKQWLICPSPSMQKYPDFDHPHYTTGILHPAYRWTPSCTSCECRIFTNKLLEHDTDSWKRFQQNFNFEVILWLLLTSTWRIRHSLWQLYRIKCQVLSPMLTFHRNYRLQLWHYSRIRILGMALVEGLQMDLEAGWVHLLKELFPVSNISCYHIRTSCG